MPSTHPPDETLRALLSDSRVIAMVGASSNPDRASNGVMGMLMSRGFTVVPVNPNEESVLGQQAYASLEQVPVRVDIVDVFRAPAHTVPIAESAVRIGAKALWLQLGVINEEAAARAREGGLTVVMDQCLAVKVATLGIRK